MVIMMRAAVVGVGRGSQGWEGVAASGLVVRVSRRGRETHFDRAGFVLVGRVVVVACGGEMVGFEVETEELVLLRGDPDDVEGRVPEVVNDGELGFVLNDAALDGNLDDAAGRFDELKGFCGGGKLDGEEGRNESAWGGRFIGFRGIGTGLAGISEYHDHEDACEGHRDHKKESP